MTGAIRNNNLSTAVRIKNPGLLILRHDRTCITCCLKIWLINLMGKYDSNSYCSFPVFISMLYKHPFFFGRFHPASERYSKHLAVYILLQIHEFNKCALTSYYGSVSVLMGEAFMGPDCSGSLIFTLLQFIAQGGYF